MKKLLALILLTFNIVICQKNLTLEEAIEHAIANSQDITIVKNDAKIIDNSTNFGAAGLLPNIIISSGYNGSINDSELKFNSFLEFGGDGFSDIEASEAQSSNITSAISLNYRLFKGFSGIYTLRKFKNQKLIANENIRFQIENMILDVVSDFYKVLNNQNIYSVFKKRYDISKNKYDNDLEKYNYGLISKLSLLNSELNLNTDKINMDNADVNLTNSFQNLYLTLNIKEKNVSLIHDFNFNTSLNIDSLLNLTMLNNSSIILAELNYSVSKYDLKISKSNFLPTVDFFSSYSYNNRQSETSFISKQTDQGIVAGINMDIPIFTGSLKRKGFQNAKINLESKKISLDKIKMTIKTSLLNAYNNYSKGLKNLELLDKNLQTVKKTAEMSKELYDLGQISNLEYRESQYLYDQAEINYSSSLINLKLQEFILYQLSGQLYYK